MAHALNFCFNPGTTIRQSLGVAENFREPLKNSCSPINGFDLVLTPGPRIITGTACLNATGDTLRVAYMIHYWGTTTSGTTPLRHVNIVLPYPALANGTGVIYELALSGNPGNEESSTNAHANPCIPRSPTLP